MSRDKSNLEGNSDTFQRRGCWPQLRAAALQTTTFLIELGGARRRRMEMQRQKEDRKEQENADEKPPLEAFEGQPDPTHGALITVYSRCCQFVNLLCAPASNPFR